MKLREALIICHPSLLVQRAAADEIALMTSMLLDLEPVIRQLAGSSYEHDVLIETYNKWKEKL